MVKYKRPKVAPTTKRDFKQSTYPEKMFLLRDASSVVERLVGLKLHRLTIWRWTTVGSFGFRLRIVSVGNQRMTCERWLMEFFEAAAEGRSKEHAAGKGRKFGRALQQQKKKGV